jgi:DHA1 family multidrug resistance protein-like MFS transporter
MSHSPKSDAGSVVTGVDGQQGWQRTLYSAWLAQFLSICAFAMVMPFMPFFIRDLGISGEAQVALWAGVVITAAGLSMAVFSPIWGNLADRVGRKIMVERAMFGGAAVLLLMGSVQNVYQLLALRACQGMLTGTVTATTALVSSVTPRSRLAYSLGLMYTAVIMGNCFGPWMGGMLADHLGYRLPFRISGVLLCIAGLAVVFLVRENFTPRPKGAPAQHGLRKSFGVKGLVALLSVFFFMSFSTTFVSPIFPLFVEKIAVGYKPASISGLLMGVTGIASGIAAVVIGRISDRVGHRKLLVCTTFCTGLLSIPQALVQSIGQLFALRIGAGFATGGTSPTMNAMIGNSVPREIYGRAYGFCTSAGSFGTAFGPLCGAFLSSHLGLRWPFAVMGFLLIGCSCLVYAFVHPKPAPMVGTAEEHALASSREGVPPTSS